MTYKNPLIVFALEAEARGHFNDLNVLYTGVGKVQAAHALTRYLATNPHPDIIINCGTAGSQVFAPKTVVCCNRFIQRDMDVTPLGFPKYVTPFTGLDAVLDGGVVATGLPVGICGTGDSFDTSHSGDHDYQVTEMEAYALALTARSFGVPFMALKYISDGADDGAHLDWEQALEHAAVALRAAVVGASQK